MIKIGSLNLSHLSGLSFSREKLRLTMTLAGIRDVAAGQIVSILSQRLRSELPTKLEVFLSDNMAQLILKPENITREYGIISIPEGVSRGAIKAMKNAMAQLTHDELLHDLEHQVAERTKELNFEKDRSEKLLQNMLPKSIAKRMKEGETIADNHEATVLFADIKGFTNMARYRSAQEVVEILDRIFSQFDTLADRHSLEKIKTIGDCYMAVAGVPTPLFDHV
ncbi:MAG: adenylate/guanylate cyclase domain-containing protein, partial [Alphaproteobacteria bacterium]|nr:adenylate/guanylate cyclase domain-containing protein [Alphaproteobacteria bacterium]